MTIIIWNLINYSTISKIIYFFRNTSMNYKILIPIISIIMFILLIFLLWFGYKIIKKNSNKTYIDDEYQKPLALSFSDSDSSGYYSDDYHSDNWSYNSDSSSDSDQENYNRDDFEQENYIHNEMENMEQPQPIQPIQPIIAPQPAHNRGIRVRVGVPRRGQTNIYKKREK